MSENLDAKGLFRILFADSKMESFISRKVAGIIYVVLAWGVALGAVFVALAALGSRGYQALALIAPVVGFLLVLILRMTFEASIALIAIAENTKK